MLRGRRRRTTPPDAVDLTSFEPRWRDAIAETIAARDRLRTVVARCPPGPLAERLTSIASRVDHGVHAAVAIATRAQAASQTVTELDLVTVTNQLKDARRRLAHAEGSGVDTSSVAAEVRLLNEQHAALSQLANTAETAAERLRMLDLRLDAAVARAAQIVLRPDATSALGAVEEDLNAVVGELDALRAGLAAVDRPPGGSG